MSILLNDRDKALQAAAYRSKTAAVTISGTSSTFLVSKNTTTVLPTTITLTATPSGSVYTANAVYTWSYALGSSPNTWVQLASGANLKTQVLNNTDSWVANAFLQYRCIVTENYLDTSYAYYTITYTKEASDPITINLSRTNILVTCDSNSVPISYNNTDQTITINRGLTSLVYSAGTTTPDSFSVSYTSANITPSAGTGSGTSWVQPAITGIALDGASITYTITVYDSATPPAATNYIRKVIYNKVSNGTIGADGTNLFPTANYDFAGSALPIIPSTVTFPGTITTSDSGTTTTIQNTIADQNLRLTNLNLVPANSYIVSVRVKWISGTWEGALYYTNPAHGEIGTYYKTITQPAIGVWTTINLDMRTLTAGGTEYMTGGNITGLRFDFINDTTSQVAIDYISIGKYGVAEATKSITVSMYQWAQSAPAYSGAFTYTWSGASVSAYPSGWTSAAGTAPASGYTLYQRNLVLVDTASALTTVSNWSLSTVNTIGYRNDGTIGIQGNSYRIAYIVTNSSTPPSIPVSGTGDVAPSGWSKTATAILTDGQYMYQTDGILDSTTGNITWGVPYLSNLKVGNLSALSANLGVVAIASGGSLYSGKATFADATTPGFFLGNDAGTPKFRIGSADNTAGMSWDGSNLNIIGSGTFTGNGTFSGNLAAAGGTFSGNLSAAGGTFSGNLSAAGGSFTGALSGSTGEFAGTLRAGVIDISTFAGISYVYTSPQTVNITVPSGKTSMRVTLLAAGGGGGAGNTGNYYDAGAGGGGGGLTLATFTVSPGSTYTLTVGNGGVGGTWAGGSGGTGENTYISYAGSIISIAYGGGGGGGSPYNSGGTYNRAAGGYAGTGTSNGQSLVSATAGSAPPYSPSNAPNPGGKGGNSRYGNGGSGAIAAWTSPPPVNATSGTGYGSGGGGSSMGLYYGQPTLAAAGLGGYAVIEFFDPNSVVLQVDYNILKSALQRQGIALT